MDEKINFCLTCGRIFESNRHEKTEAQKLRDVYYWLHEQMSVQFSRLIDENYRLKKELKKKRKRGQK